MENVTYVVDCTISASNPVVDEMCVRLNTYIAELSAFFRARCMEISATKSTAKICTTYVRTQVNAHVGPTIVGVSLDISSSRSIRTGRPIEQ